ncbi:MAG: peroxide stress protein YaaA [Rhodocyclaceae bacterium]|nr:peroxide stress protein YaaA [Rhodocyclaceae bacterium]
MLIVLSPAKALDFDTPPHVDTRSQPDFLDEAEALVHVMREKSPQEVAGLMKLSDPLASLNVARYQGWKRPFTKRNAKQAVLAFDGDVYGGLDAKRLDDQDLAWAQSHVRILSGLYGVLRPLDLMQPYRLEMGTRLDNPRGPNLYRFWGDRISVALNKVLKKQRGPSVLVNLASEEYFKAVDRRALQARVVTPVFEEWKGSSYRIISFNAKRARGLMTRFAIGRRIEDPEDLKYFDLEDYAFAPAASEGDRWVFRRGGR